MIQTHLKVCTQTNIQVWIVKKSICKLKQMRNFSDPKNINLQINIHKMGNSNQSQSFLKKGEGLRILSIKLNSPFDGKVEPFFDFIIDAIPLEPHKSPKEILDKLTAESENVRNSRVKDFNQIVLENQERKLQLKIVSTKDRNVRSIMIIPNRNWNGSMDLIGINVRKEKYDQAFDTYSPVSELKINSPIQLAGAKEGEYLLGCMEFQYNSLNNFIEGLYDRFFDKEVADKNVHLALYDMVSDEVSIKPVLLKRGWGGNGLLGCDFLQGQLYKFPNDIRQRRHALLIKQKDKVQKQKLKSQLVECDGASKTLVQALKNKRNQKGRHMQTIRKMISIPLPELPGPRGMRREQLGQIQQNYHKNQAFFHHQQNSRIQVLEKRVHHLEQTLTNIRQYLDIISSQEQGYDERQLANSLHLQVRNLQKTEISPGKQIQTK